MNFENYYGKHLPILDWTIYDANSNLKDFGCTRTDLNAIGSDIVGDFLAVKDKGLYVISHDSPNENDDYFITEDFGYLRKLFDDLLALDEFDESTPLKKLREMKKELKRIQKSAPEAIEEQFEDSIEEVSELISDWKFYQTTRGKEYLEVEKYKKAMKRALNQPNEFRYINLIKRGEGKDITYEVVGFCSKSSETVENIKERLSKINFPYPTGFSNIMSFENAKKEYERENKGLKKFEDKF